MENKLVQFTNDDIKKVGLELLQVVHDFCVKNNIRYSLGFGTLLGAIRHNGYIPWDDDIDLIMPREDYERFLETFNVKGYYVVDCKRDKKYYLPFAKVCDANTIKKEAIGEFIKNDYGFNIDIFPMDYVESLEKYRELKQKEEKLIQKRELATIIIKRGNIFKRIAKFFICLFISRKSNKYANLINNTFNRKCEKNYFCVNAIFYRARDYVFDNDIFDNFVSHKFEDKEFLITSKYDHFLSVCYGHYMNFPPVNERETHHLFKAYYKNKK